MLRYLKPGPKAFLTRLSFSTQSTSTHFGESTVEVGEKKRMVGEVFHRVAENYDIMNDLMSGGVHRLWKDSFVSMAGNIVSQGAW